MNKFSTSRNFRFMPETTEFVILSFEGPDDYALAGGLGTRVRGLARNLASRGYNTHLFYVGDPNLSGVEHWGPPRLPGNLYYRRWCQWISKHYPGGVYDGELEKLRDFENSIPHFITENIVRPAASKGKITVVMAEEWHTAQTTINLSDHLWRCGLRDKALILWNANNIYSFERINWGALDFVSNITTVSKYMKHQMWSLGLNPTVIPNGIPDNFFKIPVKKTNERPLHESARADMALLKIGRFSPDKRWEMAIRALAILKDRGKKPCLIMKGGSEPYGGEVHRIIHELGLTISSLNLKETTFECLTDTIRNTKQSDIYDVQQMMPENLLKPLYAECDAVLANSGHEPFGLVGLEVMACRGIAFLGATGEDYAIPFKNSIMLETEDPHEIVSYITYLHNYPKRSSDMRKRARAAAAFYSWDSVIKYNLIPRLVFIREQKEI